VKFTLEENLPRLVVRRRGPGRSRRGHRQRGRPGLRGQEAVTAATTVKPILICLNLGGGGIRSYPPGRHADIVTPGSPASPLRSTRPSAN
jgi:hypothetical protein